MFNRHKKLMAKRNQEKKNKKEQQAKRNQDSNSKRNKQSEHKPKRPPQLAVTVLLDSKTGTVSVATNFRSLPLTRGMLEQATDNVRQINTIRLNHLDEVAEQHAIHEQRKADVKSDKENKDAIHHQMRKNE